MAKRAKKRDQRGKGIKKKLAIAGAALGSAALVAIPTIQNLLLLKAIAANPTMGVFDPNNGYYQKKTNTRVSIFDQ